MKETEFKGAADVRPAGGGGRFAGAPLRHSIIAVLSLAGLCDAIYLTIEHYQGQSVRCTVTSGCSEVLGSSYAVLGSVPISAIGAAAYFIVFSLATLIAFGHTRLRNALALLVALMCATSLWLLYVQAFVLKAFCQYCLLSAGISLTLGVIVILDRARNNANRQ